MKLHPRVTRSAVELVKRFEGLRRGAAQLADGGWTVGYGHTRSAREGAIVTAEDAEALLYYDLSEVAYKIDAWSFTPLNQNQFEALTAFAFNIGVENFRRSTVLKRVNEGNHLLAAAALELWRKADFDGENLVIDALVRRRAAEKSHYLTPPEGYRPSPSPVLRPTFDHSVIEAAANYRAGRAAAVIDTPPEGDKATALMQPREATAPGADDAAFPTGEPQTPAPFAAAAPAAAAVSTARLLQLFPDKFAERMRAASARDEAAATAAVAPAPSDPFPQPPPPFALTGDEDEPAPPPVAMNDSAPQSAPGEAQAPPRPRPEPSRFAVGFGGFTPPPVRQFDVPPPFPTEGGQAVSAASETQPISLFDAPSVRAPFRAEGGFRPVSAHRDPFAPAPDVAETGPHSPPVAVEQEAPLSEHPPGPLQNRSMIYLAVGILGAALFAAALFSMFSAKASPLNLVIGLMGILLMAPAGGYFLLRFLNKRDGVAEADEH